MALMRSGASCCVVVDLVTDELDRVHERIAGRFARAEPRARVRRYVPGLVAGLERKNGWTLAEQAGGGVPGRDAAAAAPGGLGRGRGSAMTSAAM
jgi:hypothetical protein